MMVSDLLQQTGESAKPKSIRILYMEDEPGLARLFQRRMELAGYEVEIARDGQEEIGRAHV